MAPGYETGYSSELESQILVLSDSDISTAELRWSARCCVALLKLELFLSHNYDWMQNVRPLQIQCNRAADQVLRFFDHRQEFREDVSHIYMCRLADRSPDMLVMSHYYFCKRNQLPFPSELYTRADLLLLVRYSDIIMARVLEESEG